MLWEHNTGHTVFITVMSCSGHRGQILHPFSALLSLSDTLLVEMPVPLSISHPLSLHLVSAGARQGHGSCGCCIEIPLADIRLLSDKLGAKFFIQF